MSSGRLTGVDAGRALVVTAISAALVPFSGDEARVDAGAFVLVVVACAPVAWVRTAPHLAALAAASAAILGSALGYILVGPLILTAVLVAIATSRTDARMVGALRVASAATFTVTTTAQADAQPVLAAIGGLAVGLVPALIGERLRAERARARDAHELARRVEELRDRDIDRAVAEERLRIARDVHDITGHHLSAIALQAAGAGRTTADAAARAGFERIHGLTRDALNQTRRALGVLRQESEPAALAPLPRLAHVEHLLEPSRAAGLDVALRVEGRARELSETVELCAYRVIQESLTNVVRHAGASAVRVVVDYGEEALTLAVDDDGAGAVVSGAVRAGSGIEGMRERLALVGGALAAGPLDTGGWSVRATLPLEDRR